MRTTIFRKRDNTMLVEYPYGKNYLFTALEAGPELLETMIEGLTAEEADLRPESERFTIREAVAHLADWEPIFLGRMKRICAEDRPKLVSIDEGQLAIDNEYDKTDPQLELKRFREGRQTLIAFLREREDSDWRRIGDHFIGELSLEAMAFLPAIHDAYHLKQINDYRKIAKKG